MKVSFKIGYSLYVGEVTGAELETFARVLTKIAQREERFLDSKAESSPGTPHSMAGRYVFVRDGNPDKLPDVRIEVIPAFMGDAEISKEAFEKMNADADARREAAKAVADAQERAASL